MDDRQSLSVTHIIKINFHKTLINKIELHQIHYNIKRRRKLTMIYIQKIVI